MEEGLSPDELTKARAVAESQAVQQMIGADGFPKFSGKGADWDAFYQLAKHILNHLPWSNQLLFDQLWRHLPTSDRETINCFRAPEPDPQAALEALNQQYADPDRRFKCLAERIRGLPLLTDSIKATVWTKLIGILADIDRFPSGRDKTNLIDHVLNRFPRIVQRHLFFEGYL